MVLSDKERLLSLTDTRAYRLNNEIDLIILRFIFKTVSLLLIYIATVLLNQTVYSKY